MSEFSFDGNELPSLSTEDDVPNFDAGDAVTVSSISREFSISLDALRKVTICLVKQAENSQQSEIVLSKSAEKYSRLKTWGEETGAAWPPNSRGSLDHVIRNDVTLKDMVRNVLEKIARQATNAIITIESPPEDIVTEEDSENDTESSSDSDNDEWVINPESDPKKPAVWRTLRQIEEDIRSLFQISLLIKRPGFTRRYLHSTDQAHCDRRVAHYTDFDQRHIEEKLLDWNKTPNHQDEEQIASPEVLTQRVSISGALATLMSRLARANTKRREQLFYWSKHPDHNPTVVDTVLETSGQNPTPKPAKREGEKDKDSRKDGDDRAKSDYAKSMMSRQTFSTRVVSDKIGALTEAGPARTTYAESTTARQMSNRVPDVPSTSLRQKTFECPYCHLDLDSVLMRRRQEWKRHVFRDLRPYVCTFLECQTPDKQYQSRHDWVYHEMQIHRRKWVCEEHGSEFSTADEFVGHLGIAHASTVTQSQISTLSEISERPCDENEVFRCPLCPDARKLVALRTHLAGHLESISLFALSGISGTRDDFVDQDKEENTNSDIAAGGSRSSSSTEKSDVNNIEEGDEEETREITELRENLGINDETYTSNQRELRTLQANRAPGTFEWMLSHPSFVHWFGPGRPNIAWLFGTDNCGKSTMASFIAAHVVHTQGICVYYPIDEAPIGWIWKTLFYYTVRRFPALLQKMDLDEMANMTWSVHESNIYSIRQWEALFRGGLFQTASNKVIYWIIDNVENVRNLDSFLSELLAVNASKIAIKVLLVSKWSYEIDRAFNVVEDVVPLFMFKA